MKKATLYPTEENIQKTFLNDTLGRNDDLKNFIEILSSIEDNYSIAIDSAWGSGKTFFVKQLKMIFDANNDYTYSSVENKEQILDKWKTLIDEDSGLCVNSNVTIYYDAWENDNDYDPIYSLVYTIIQEIDNEEGLQEKIEFSDILKVAGKITGAIAGVNPEEILDSLNKGAFLDELKSKKAITANIKVFLDKILSEHGNRLIIIIDELDRCKPSFAVKLLEQIKHYFDNDRIVFVFSVNLSELQHTIKHYYGFNFDAGKYLDRFFDLRISLPPADISKFYQSIGYYCESSVTSNSINLVIKKYNMQLREISKYVKITNAITLAYKNTGYRPDVYLSYTFLHHAIFPFVIGLNITNPTKYRDFINGKDYSALTEFYDNYETINNASYAIGLLYDGQNMIISERRQISDIQNELKEFYQVFFNSTERKAIGKCIIDTEVRNYFSKVVSLLAQGIVTQFTKLNEE